MTASMPAAQDPDEGAVAAGDAAVEAAPRPVAPLPASKTGGKKRPGKKGGTKKRPAATQPEPAEISEPGPPPPLPVEVLEADGETILVPPKPPLPARHEPEPAASATAPEVASPAPDLSEPEPEPAPEPEPEPEPEPADHRPEPERVVAVVDAVGEIPQASTPAVELRGIVKAFGDTRAVDGIDLTVPAGSFYGVVGPNGAGKTTTLSMVAGLLRPTRGTIRVAGIDAAADPVAAKRVMGVLPDRLRTFDRLTGRQLLYYYGILRGLRPDVVESRTADLARAFDLTDSLGRVVSDYSAGMTKKIMLAGALIHSPRLLVLDEPFEAVDPVSSAVILDILGAYVAHGGTVMLSSHGMELVERVCTRVAVLVAGQVLAEGTVDEVRGELTLEQRFIELSGGLGDVEGLEWLHTFSD
ncbi:ABC transporter ATP-binding protein [Microbacterium sp.]|uniref:ABC transporter ATP-binding protein n=2 Tax=Microbacterium sp. TaxID=51671 RepID=UPI0037C544A9